MTLLFPGRERKTRSRSKPPRQREPRPPRLLWLRNLRLSFAAHPRRAAAFGAVGLLLVGFIAVSSLPMALAESYPRLALMLHPDHPRALMALAREERRAIAASAQPATDQPPANAAPADTAPEADPQASAAASAQAEADAQAGGNAEAAPGTEAQASTDRTNPPAPNPDMNAPEPAADAAQNPVALPSSLSPEELESRRDTIRDLAARAIARAPLSADAYRMLGDTSGDLGANRQAMTEALARSRRETVAAFWLMHQDYERGDYKGVVQMADILLKTRPELNRFTLSYLYSLALRPDGRDALIPALASHPNWRDVFFANLGVQLAASDAPLTLFQQLKEAGSGPTERELVPFLWGRIQNDKSVIAAYNIWLQLLPADDITKVRAVNNLDFAQPPSDLPFNWSVQRSVNVFVDFLPRAEAKSGRTLRIRFGVGRVGLKNITQIAFLPPGNYRFTGMQKGAMSAKRGLRWQVICYYGPMAGQSDQLMGSPREWREFAFDVAIPDGGRCDAQVIRLTHDVRSASEQFASGEIMFESLRIERVETPDAATNDQPG